MGLFYIKPEDKNKFLQDFKKALAAINQEVVEVYRGYVLNALHAVVRETPQWSGGAASNWNLDWGAPTYRVDTDLKSSAAVDRVGSLLGLNVKDKRDKRAWEIAFSRAVGTVNGLSALVLEPRGAFKLPTIFINNAAKELDGTLYIQHLEENPNNYLRKENEPGHMVYYAVQSMNGLGPGGAINGYVGPLRRIRLGDVASNLI